MDYDKKIRQDDPNLVEFQRLLLEQVREGIFIPLIEPEAISFVRTEIWDETGIVASIEYIKEFFDYQLKARNSRWN